MSRLLTLSDLRDLFGDLTLNEALARRGYVHTPGPGRYGDDLSRRARSGRYVRVPAGTVGPWQYLARVELKLAALLRVPACFYCGFPITGDCGKYDTLPPDECASCFERHVEAAMAHINNPER